MIQAKCIQKCKDKNGKICEYYIKDINGITKIYKPLDLKNLIRSNLINVINLRLTSDGRLINKTSIHWNYNKVKYGKDKNNNPLYFEIHTMKVNNAHKSINIIVEDKGSALNIIKEIILLYNNINNTSINARIIIAGGNGRIPFALQLCQKRRLNNIILIYDEIDNSLKLINKINKEYQIIKSNGNTVISIVPICIEELCLSFESLSADIINISESDLDILNIVHDNYLNNIQNYFNFDPISNNYTLNGKVLKLGYASKHIRKYKSVNTKEKFLADKLAAITFNNPYEFIKSANICWYKNCANANCKKLKNKCNKTLLNDNKVEAIISKSLFGLMYDAIDIIITGKSNYIVNYGTENRYIK